MGVATQPLAFGNSASDGNDVLDRAAGFGTDKISALVGTEGGAGDCGGDTRTQCFVGTGYGDRRRQALRHFAGEIRAGQYPRCGLRQNGFQHFRHQAIGAALDALSTQNNG